MLASDKPGAKYWMKAISYALYGQMEAYLRGVVENCERAKRVYPGWTVFIWTDGSSPDDVLGECARLGAEIRIVPNPRNPDPMYLRLHVVSEAEIFIMRDLDCRLSQREAEAVDQWLDSGKPFHLMHDHRCHTHPVMGGMWGGRSSAIPDQFREKLFRATGEMEDQHFLTRWLWQGLLEDRPDLYVHHHGSGWRCGSEIPFPSPRWGKQFVGDTFFRGNYLENIDEA